MEGIKPSILIIILILLITVIVSVSLCLLLRHLNSRCLRHLFRPTSVAAATGSSRISPAQTTTSSVADSLPMFTFSSITRPASVISGDCAICLSKFEAQDQLRLLPLCCHAFHTECIDTWLNSNQSCPLCRFPIYASDAEVLKVVLSSFNGGVHDSFDGSDSFRIEIGTVSRRRQTDSESGERRRSYSIGSFDYIVDGLSEVSMNIPNQRSASEKEEVGGTEEAAAAAPEENLAAEVASGRSWLKEYIDRLSFSASSRALSFRTSGSFFTGSSRRSDVPGVGDWDVEANRAGEEISEYFRWLSGV